MAAKARLRFDCRHDRFLLLYPERGLILSRTAGDILRLCNGDRTIGMIADDLAARNPEIAAEDIRADVLAFLADLHGRGLIRE
ncbi:MAG: pyrroloquinoline quinone biosynthesis peptide chaperone PqqD [Nitrospira sp.]